MADEQGQTDRQRRQTERRRQAKQLYDAAQDAGGLERALAQLDLAATVAELTALAERIHNDLAQLADVDALADTLAKATEIERTARSQLEAAQGFRTHAERDLDRANRERDAALDAQRTAEQAARDADERAQAAEARAEERFAAAAAAEQAREAALAERDAAVSATADADAKATAADQARRSAENNAVAAGKARQEAERSVIVPRSLPPKPTRPVPTPSRHSPKPRPALPLRPAKRTFCASARRPSMSAPTAPRPPPISFAANSSASARNWTQLAASSPISPSTPLRPTA